MKSFLGTCFMFLLAWFSYQVSTPSPTPKPSIQIVRIGPSDVAKLALVNPDEVFLTNMIPSDQSAESSQDSEPFLAVHPDQKLMVGAVYYGESTLGNKPPPLFLSKDGGKVWSLVSIIPAKKIWSQSYCFSDTGKNFYGSISTEISGGQPRDVNVILTEDPANNQPAKNISVLSSGSVADQPFIQVRSLRPVGQSANQNGESEKRVDRIYVGQNYFGSELPEGQTASVRVSVDGGNTFRLFGVEARSTGGARQDGPSVRPAIARDGTVYVAFFHWTAQRGPNYSGDLVVVRDDDGATGQNSFQSLIEPTDGKPGRKVVSDRLFPYGQSLGQQEIGSPLSLAVDPTQSSTLYLAWVDFDPPLKSNVLHVKRSTDRGQTWSNDLLSVPSSINPALAVADNGDVGLLYQQLSGPKGNQRWETRFRKSQGGVGGWTDVTLTTFPTSVEPERQYHPYLGYRVHLLSVRNNFYGIFSAPNVPDPKYFPQGVEFQRKHEDKELWSEDGKKVGVSIDPYFFRIPASQGKVSVAYNTAPNVTPTPEVSLGLMNSNWGVLVWIALAGLVFALFFVFYQYRTPKMVDRALTERVKPPPSLTNYEGFIAARFRDKDGNTLSEIAEGSECDLIIDFHKEQREAQWEKRISLQGGETLPEVVFTLVIDTDDFEVARDHKTISVPVNQTREVSFPLIAMSTVEEHSIFVQVFQSTQLVQILAPTLPVQVLNYGAAQSTSPSA